MRWELAGVRPTRRDNSAARTDSSCGTLVLASAALAVSDLDAPHRPPEHRGYYNVCELALECSAMARSSQRMPQTADALTKCILLCGPHRTHQVLRLLAAEMPRTKCDARHIVSGLRKNSPVVEQ